VIPLLEYNPAWKWSRPISIGKDKREVNMKGKYKQGKKELSYKKQRGARDKVNNTQKTIYIVPKSTMFLGCIRPSTHKG